MNTQETDAELNLYFRHGEAHQISVAWIEFARKLERERDEARDVVKILCDEKPERPIYFQSDIDEWMERHALSVQECEELQRERDEAREKLAHIIVAAQAVVDRWEHPIWKDTGPTASVIYRLRDALEVFE